MNRRDSYDMLHRRWGAHVGHTIMAEPVDVVVSVLKHSRDGFEWWTERVLASGFKWHHKLLDGATTHMKIPADFTLN